MAAVECIAHHSTCGFKHLHISKQAFRACDVSEHMATVCQQTDWASRHLWQNRERGEAFQRCDRQRMDKTNLQIPR